MNESTPFLADLAASQKFLTGDWIILPAEGRILNRWHDEVKGTITTKGYLYACTKWHGITVNIPLHRAIWIGAHGGIIPDPELQIDHINGDKQNNRITNLWLCTRKENCNNPNAPCYRLGEAHPLHKLTDAQRIEICREWEEGQNMLKGHGRPTTRSLAIKYGVAQSTINNVIQRYRKEAKKNE